IPMHMCAFSFSFSLSISPSHRHTHTHTHPPTHTHTHTNTRYPITSSYAFLIQMSGSPAGSFTNILSFFLSSLTQKKTSLPFSLFAGCFSLILSLPHPTPPPPPLSFTPSLPHPLCLFLPLSF